MNFHDPAMVEGGKVVMLTGPFGAPERTIALDRPMAVAEIIAAHDLHFRLPTVAVMNGEPVMRGTWAVRMVKPGEVLAFVAVPRGGGEGNSQGKQIAGLIAALALSVAAPMIGGWVAGAVFGGSALAANLVTAAVMVGGSLLLNALMPPPVAASQNTAATEAVYSVTAASNQATPLKEVPVLYGRLRFAPRFASRPYSEYQGNDQYLYQLFTVTAGTAEIERIDIGETEAWNAVDGYSASFSDLEFEIVQPGGQVTLFPANVVTSAEVSGQTVPDPAAVLGPFVVNAAGTTVDRLAVDFAFLGGLWTADKRGVASNSAALRAQYRQIDDNGDPVGGWADIFAQTISAATRTPQRFSRATDVDPGRYEVRFLADQPFDPDDGNAVNTCVWTGLRGYLTDFVTPPNATLLAMKIRANEQLSQFSSSQVRVTATRHLPVHDGMSWSAPQSTRSIAWAAADLLRNADYSIGLADTQYDLAKLVALDATWSGRGDTFNAIFDRSWTVRDALKAILRAGRAQPVRLGGRIGFVRLEPRSLKRAAFTPRNVVRGSFSHKLVLFDEEKPDSVLGRFIDETSWQTREVKASLAAIGADAPQEIEWFGITDEVQVWRESVTEAAVNAYQREFVGFTADWEGKLLVRGDPILVMHPFIEGVETAALVTRAGDVLTIDRDQEMAITGDAYVILRGKDGREWGPCLVSSITGRDITLDAADRAAVEAGMGVLSGVLPHEREERAHVLICDGETRPFNGLVVSATPNGSGRVDVLAVIDAPEVYLADATEVMPSPWTPPVLPPQNPARPIVLGLYAQLRPGVAGLELDAVWQPSRGVLNGYVAEVSYDDGVTWTPVYQGTNNRLSVSVLPQPLVLRVAPIGVLQGAWSVRAFALGEVPDVRLPGDYLGLDAVEIANLAQELRNERGMLVGAGAGSLAERLAEFEERMTQAETAALTDQVNLKEAYDLLKAQNGASLAAVAVTRRAIAELETAFAEFQVEVAAQLEQIMAGGLLRIEAEVDEVTSSARIIFKARAQAGDAFGEGVLQIGATADLAGGTSDSWIGMMADRLYFLSTGGEQVTAPFAVEADYVKITTLYFDNLKSTATFDGVNPIIDLEGSTGAWSITIPDAP